MSSNRSFFITVFLGALAAIALATGVIVIRDPGADLHESLRFAVTWRLWFLAVVDVLPIALASALLIFYSLIVKAYGIPRGTSLLTAFRVHVATIVVLGLFMVVWHAALAPRLRMVERQKEHQSTLAVRAWDDAQTAYEEGDYREAREKAGIYGAITGESVELEEFYNDLEISSITARNVTRPVEPVEEMRESDVKEQTVVDLIEQAQTYFDQGRYYSAQYYASRAIAMSPVERLDARRLQQRSLEAIQDEGRAIEEEEESEYFQDKFAAYTALQRSADSPEMLIEAYYRFQALVEERPDDPDVQRYFPEITVAMADISFFLDTARSYETYPGVHHLVFENERSEFISFDRLVQVREGVFVYGIEIIRLDGDGATVYHLRAPYGKVIGEDLVLRAVRRDGISVYPDDNLIGPEYLVGERPPELRSFFPLRHSVDDITRFGPGSEWLQQENIGRLFMAVPVFARLGLPVTGIYVQLIERILRSFGFIIFLLAVMAIGWRYRSRYMERPPVLVLLTVPFVPFAVWGVAEFVRYLVRLILVVVFSYLGRNIGMALLLAIPIVALLWILSSLARQKSS